MKKYFSILLALVLALSFMAIKGPQHVYAQGFGMSWGSSVQVMNLSTTDDAGISMYYYNQDGTLATMTAGYSNPDTDTVLIGQSNTYYPVHAAAGFNGSMVVESTAPVAVISNLTVNSAQVGVGSYVAFQGGATTIYFPMIMKGNSNNNSVFNIQNTGADSAEVTIQFSPLSGGGYASPSNIVETIAAGAAHTYDLSTLANFSGITKWIGGATATVTDTVHDSIAGVANTVSTKYAAAYGLSTYNAFTSGSTTVKVPLVMENNNGNRTSINCLNLGTATTITATYTGSSAKAAQNQDVPAGGMAVFIQDYNTAAPTFVGSALVTTSPAMDIACVINQQKPAMGTVSSYEGFDPASATGTVLLPLIQSRNGNASKGWAYTSINLATSDGAAHPVTCDFKPSPTFADPASVSGNSSSLQFIQSDVYGTGATFVGGAICTVTDSSGAGLFAIVNQARSSSPVTPRDYLSSYDGFNQ